MAPAQDRIYPLPLSKQIEDHDSMDLSGNGMAQVEIRWSWFADAERIDKIRATDLGTLGYLPWELRRQILMVLLPQLPIRKVVSHAPDLHFEWWFPFDGWALRPLGSATMPLSHSLRSLLGSHHATRVTSRFDNLEQFENRGRLEYRPYFSACAPRFNFHRSLKVVLAVPEDDVVQTFSERDIIDVRPEELWAENPFFLYHGFGDATIRNLRHASRNLKEEFDSDFFATHNCFIATPRTLELFLVPILSIYEHDEASEKAQMEHWYAALESLPSDLKSLSIYLRYRKKTASGWNTHFQRLDMILNKARRYAPGAKITIGMTYVHKTQEDRLRDPDTSEETMIRGIRNLIQELA